MQNSQINADGLDFHPNIFMFQKLLFIDLYNKQTLITGALAGKNSEKKN